jgi:hypothetical protein
VTIASAKDDGLLLGPAGRQQIVEQVLRHGGHALREEQSVLEGGRVIASSRRDPANRLAGVGIAQGLALEIFLIHAGLALVPWLVIEEDVASYDLAGGEVAVLDALSHVVLVDGLAEVAEVVGIDLAVGLGLTAPLAHLELSRGRRQADLHGIRVAREHLGPLAPGRAVALVDDDMAEVVHGVVRDQERRRRLVGVDVERLIGRDQDARILLGVAARHGRRVGSEFVLEGRERLVPELVPIADEEGAMKLTGGGDLPEELHRDIGLSGPGGQRQEGPLLTACQLLEHGTDGRVLIVAASPLPARIAHEQGSGRERLEAEAHGLLVPCAELSGCRELRQRLRVVGKSRPPVALDEEVAIRRVGKGYVEALAGGVRFGLLDPMCGWQVFGLGLDQGHRDGLAFGIDPNAQHVVDASTGAPTWATVHHFDGAGRLLATDQILGPAPSMEGRVDELGPSVGLAESHAAWSIYGRDANGATGSAAPLVTRTAEAPV